MRLRAASVVGHPSGRDVLVDDGGRIEAVVEPDLAVRPDVAVHELSPGFVDWQVNGVGSDDVWTALLADDFEGLVRIGSALLDHGVTAWCPTLVTASLHHYSRAFRTFRHGVETLASTGRTAHPVGLHLEGPFLGRAPGAHRAQDIVPIDLDFVKDLPAFVRVLTIAAEALAADRGIGERTLEHLGAKGIVVSIGHSRPHRAEYEFAVDNGARAVTHLFNAMSGTHHREPGLAAWALIDERVHCGLIADAVHVAPEMVALAFAAAPDRITVVSDQVAIGSDSAVRIVDGAPRRADGTIAGSVGTASQALAVATSAGVDRHRVLRAMSTTPAAMLGLHDRGTIAPGRRADLVGFDVDGRLVGVWMDGRRVR